MGLLDAAAQQARDATAPTCGRACAPTTSPSCPPTTARSASRTRRSWALGDFSKIPNGIGGVEHRVDLLYQGVVDGKLSLERWVETIATTPARMFGLYPRKGIIAPGSDADIVVYDPNGRTRISVETHHMNMDHSAWEGYEIAGKVDTVLSRGDGDRRPAATTTAARATASSCAAASRDYLV